MSIKKPTRQLTFGTLRDIAQALSGTRDLDTTLDLIVHKTTELLAVDSCTIYLHDGHIQRIDGKGRNNGNPYQDRIDVPLACHQYG